MDIRRFGAPLPLARLHAEAHARGLRDLLRHQVPGPRARGRAAAARRAGLRLAPRARRRVRREVGLGAGELVRVERRRRGRVAAAARLGGRALVARRSAPSTAPRARRPALFDETSFAKLEVAGRAPPRCSSACATTDVGARTSARSPTRRCSTRRGGIECDFTVTRVDEERFSIVTGTAFGSHDLAWIAPPRGRRRGVTVARRHLALGVLRRCGARARATSCRRCTPHDLLVPVHVDARASRSATCRCARCA